MIWIVGTPLRTERTHSAPNPGLRQSGATRDQLDPTATELLGALLEWRRNLARASGVPAYVIFHDTTLEAVARDRPRSRGDLLTIPGIGPVKLQRHGQALLELVGQHAG